MLENARFEEYSHDHAQDNFSKDYSEAFYSNKNFH